jgi:hypothetical protein
LVGICEKCAAKDDASLLREDFADLRRAVPDMPEFEIQVVQEGSGAVNWYDGGRKKWLGVEEEKMDDEVWPASISLGFPCRARGKFMAWWSGKSGVTARSWLSVILIRIRMKKCRMFGLLSRILYWSATLVGDSSRQKTPWLIA